MRSLQTDKIVKEGEKGVMRNEGRVADGTVVRVYLGSKGLVA